MKRRRWPAGRETVCVRPPFRHKPPMPSQQGIRRNDERSPVAARQDTARRRQEEPVDCGHRRTLGLPTEDGQFVPEYGDFQLFELRRAPPPDRQRQDTMKKKVAKGEQHGEPPTESDAGLSYASV
jgi:hypothetical protein